MQDTPAWESTKENAAPLERGRNVAALERQSSIPQEERDQMVRHYERLVRPSEKGSTTTTEDDPLIHWLSYIKYHQEAFPADTHGQFLLLERCTRALVNVERYANDVRFIRVCVMYADKTSVPGDIFKYLHQEKVGVTVALFWIAWAWVAENKGDYAFCERIYKKAMSKQAKPMKLLQQRYQQFQRRMSRHWLNASSTQHEEEEEEQQQARGALGYLSRDDTRVNDRRQRNDHGSSHHSSHSNNNNPSLSTFSVRSRPAVGGRSVAANRSNSNTSSKGGFDIFVEDETEQVDHGYDLDQSRDESRFTKREIVREAERAKENTLAAQRWNEHGGLATGATSANASHGLPLPAAQHRRSNSTGFAIHVDDECAVKHDEDERKRAPMERDERTLRQKIDGGMAEKLARDPLRYVRHPSKLEADLEHDTEYRQKSTTLSDGLKPKKGKSDGGISCGFSKRLLAKDANGREQCFEEGRAHAAYFRIVDNSSNFNLLAIENDDTMSRATVNNSAMEQSIEDVDMEEVEQENVGSSSRDGMPRKALFGSNTSFDSRSNSFAAHNTSTASSTVNENDAVGVPGGKEEETINTKLAMKELSMMFSSPAMGLEDIDEGPTEPAGRASTESEDGGQTATFSVVAELIQDSNNNAGSDSFVEYNDENQAPRNPVARTNATPGFDQCALRTMGPSEVEQGPRQVLGEQTVDSDASSPVSTADFDIYRDDTIDQAPAAATAEPMAFEIYCDEENKSVENNQDKPSPPARAPFQVFHDSQEQESGDDQGETATFSIFGDAMRALGDANKPVPPSQNEQDSKASPSDDFKQYHRPQRSGTVLMDTADFGDISRIVADELDVSCERGMKRALSPEVALSFNSDAIDYKVLHKDDVTSAIWQLQDKARELAGRKASRNARISPQLLAEKGLIFHRPGHSMPRALFRKKESASEGTEIEIGEQTGVVKQELGRGSYGVVVLLDAANGSATNGEDDIIAVKAQMPTDCLAWEYTILRKIEDRISEYWTKTMNPAPFPYPKALSFVSLADGGLLGMTAGSKSGLNLVDLTNIYKVKERGPVPELIALHYTARMLTHMETLHWHGKILHCDVKPDNWVIVSSSEAYRGCEEEIDGSDLMLVDFGRAVDLTSAAKAGIDPLEVKLCGDASAEDMTCVAMRKGLGWSFDIDTYGICASAHVLLYGSHLEIEFNSRSQRWRSRKPLRRYWNKDLWNELFDTLLNVDGSVASRPHSLRSLRKSFERFLGEGTNGKQLESLLKHQARILPKKRLS